MALKINDIQSKDNAVFKKLQSLLTSRGIKKENEFIVSGVKVIKEILKSHPSLCRSIIFPATLVEEALALKPRDKDVAFSRLQLSKELFAELDIAGTRQPLLLVRTPSQTTWSPKQAPEGLEVFCALSEPSNLGAVVRSAAAFGATKIVLLKECSNPYHPKAVRAASGAVLQMKFQDGPSIKDLQGDDSAPFVMLDLGGQAMGDFEWTKNVRLLIGEEGQGIPENLEGLRVSIPMQKGVESLNASVSASIAFYAYKLAHKS